MNKKALDGVTKYMQDWLRFRYERLELPGFTVAVAHKGEVIFNEAYGYADLEKKAKLTTDHIFRIASHSKTFTATAIMQLQEQGKLRIDDAVVDYVPWLKEHTDQRFLKVTIRQLLSHSAGVIRDGKNADYWRLRRPFPNSQEFKKEILEADLVFDTNVQMKYSNFGYTLLGLVIEAISSNSYAEYVQKNIVDKLGLKNTGPEYSPAIKDKLVTGYTGKRLDKKRLPIEIVDTRAMASATGFYANAQDLCAYFSAQMVGSGKLLSDESKKEMQRTQWRVKNTKDDEEYGLGLEIDYQDDRRYFGHGGGFPGHITSSLCDPENEIVVVVLTNCIDGGAMYIAKGVLAVIDYFVKNVSDEKPKHDLSNLAGRYMDIWGIADIVVTGDKIICAYPDTWQPFRDAEELEYVNQTTLKVSKVNGYYSEGELVTFMLDEKGAVKSINHAGMTMIPEADWVCEQAKLTKISLP